MTDKKITQKSVKKSTKNTTKNLQHVQVPNNMCLGTGLEPFDLLVYANIKRYMNQETKEAYPSRELLRTVIGSGDRRISQSIEKLSGKFMGVYNKGKKKVYTFKRPYKHFEPCSTELLDKEDLTPNEKGYLIATQQYMFKDLQGYGKVTFSVKELSKLINMPEWEIWKCDKALRDKGYLEVLTTKNRDFDTGLPIKERLYNLEKLGQGIIWELSRYKKMIEQNDKTTKRLKKDIKKLLELLDKKTEENAQLKKEQIQVLSDVVLNLN